MSIICNKCNALNCRNNESCIKCGSSPLNGSVQDINSKIVIKFLREKKVLDDYPTRYIVVNNTQIDLVEIMAELLTRRERDSL